MTRVLAHRGPDGESFACIDPATGQIQVSGTIAPDAALSGILFGHRRLSILGPGPTGDQPMLSQDGLSLLAFNGEIYNFVELREQLRGGGISFRGHSDTEVLLESYLHWGSGVFDRLNGMWAFALWDGRRRKLIVSRDRFGVKPLYYARVGETWIFASEIKALMEFPELYRGVDHAQVREYLVTGRVDQRDRTLFQGVHAVPAGTFLEIDGATARTERYWRLPASTGRNQESTDELILEFAALLRDSVRIRSRSDVPLGTMMSGGLDSTTITAMVRQEQRSSARSGDVFPGLRAFHQVYSACWPGSEHDEEVNIDLMTASLGLTTRKLYPTAATIADVLPAVTYHLEQPFRDPIAAVQFLLMRAAREDGVVVVLNGHGSDESLAGYADAFVPPYLASLLLRGRLTGFVREQHAFAGTGWETAHLVEHGLLLMIPSLLRQRVLRGVARRELERKHGLLDGSPISAPAEAEDDTSQSGHLTALNAALWRKLSREILPAWLRMEDRMSMAASVESRLPFLDYRLVEFAFRLPDNLKLRDGFTKYILRQAMKNTLPAPLVQARIKRRFRAPYESWFRGPWREMVLDLLERPMASSYLDRRSFRPALETYLSGRRGALSAQLLWRVLGVELWLRMIHERWASGNPLPVVPEISPHLGAVAEAPTQSRGSSIASNSASNEPG